VDEHKRVETERKRKGVKERRARREKEEAEN